MAIKLSLESCQKQIESSDEKITQVEVKGIKNLDEASNKNIKADGKAVIKEDATEEAIEDTKENAKDVIEDVKDDIVVSHESDNPDISLLVIYLY